MAAAEEEKVAEGAGDEQKSADTDQLSAYLELVGEKGNSKLAAQELLKEVQLANIFSLLASNPDEFLTISETLKSVFDPVALGPELVTKEEVQTYLLMGLQSEHNLLQQLALTCCASFHTTDDLAGAFLKSKLLDAFWACFVTSDDEVNQSATEFLGKLCARAPVQKYILDESNVKKLLKEIDGSEARLRLTEAISQGVSGTKFLVSSWFNQVLEWLTDEDILTKLNAIKLLISICGETTYKNLVGQEVLQKFIGSCFADEKLGFINLLRMWCLKLLTAMMESTNRAYIAARDNGKLSELGSQFQGCLALKPLAAMITSGLSMTGEPNVLEAALALSAHVCYNPKGINIGKGTTIFPSIGKLADHKDESVQAIALRSVALILETKAPGSKYAKQQVKALAAVTVADKTGLDAIVARADGADGALRMACLHCLKNLFEQEFAPPMFAASKDAVTWLVNGIGDTQLQQLKQELAKILLSNKLAKQLKGDQIAALKKHISTPIKKSPAKMGSP